jgi:4-amino-4-deoxy-L-arabinose transferase-like glycosyltransferase
MLKKDKINNIFYIFLIIHLVIWASIPALTNTNLPLDTIEALAWGSSLDWGFNKHPPLSAFFPELFYQIFGPQDWAYYLLSQIFVIISFIVVWKFSQEFFNNRIYSLFSVLLLEGIYFYNFTTPEFNVNVCLLPFWALSILYCWKGIKDDKISDWLLLGLFIALGILSKYLFIYVAGAIDVVILYMIVKKKISFKCIVSLFSFIFVLSPHLIWLTENNYVTITYGLHRTGSGDQNILDHIVHPLIFLGKQIGILIPFFIMNFFLISKFKLKINFKDEKLLFLLIINIVPILLMFLTSMIMGVKIRTMWMTPFYLFFGVLIVYIFQAQINLKKLNSFISIFLILFIFSPFAYSYISVTKTEKRTDYPGKEMAEKIEIVWNKKYEDKIDLVIGSEWYVGNLSYHLSSRPKWIENTNQVPKNFKGGYLIVTNEPLCLFSAEWDNRKPTLELISQENTNMFVCMNEIK